MVRSQARSHICRVSRKIAMFVCTRKNNTRTAEWTPYGISCWIIYEKLSSTCISCLDVGKDVGKVQLTFTFIYVQCRGLRTRDLIFASSVPTHRRNFVLG
jgi:hypothetical protein